MMGKRLKFLDKTLRVIYNFYQSYIDFRKMKLNRKQTQINLLQKEVSEITGDVSKNPETFYEIRRYSNLVGYIISPKLAERLFDYMEEREMLKDKALFSSMIEARKELESGKGHELEKVLDEIEDK